MRATRIFTRGLVCGVLLLGLTASAKAGFTVALDTGSPTGSGPFTYNYTATTTANDAIVAGPVPTPGATNYGSFFRIYDFAGLVSGSIVAPAGWTASVNLLDPTPPPNTINPLPLGDNPLINNITFTFTSGSTISGANTFTGFSAKSIYNTAPSSLKNFVGSLTNTVAPFGFVDSIGTVQVPVPEPTSVLSMLIGGGLLGLFARRRLRNIV